MKKSLFLTLVTLFAIFSGINAQNLIQNGDFENDFNVVTGEADETPGDDWKIYWWEAVIDVVVEAETEAPISGKQSCKLELNTLSNMWWEVQFVKNPVPITPNDYTFECNYTVDQDVVAIMVWSENSGDFKEYTKDSVYLLAGSGTWTHDFAIEETVEGANFKLFFGQKENEGATVILDDIYLGEEGGNGGVAIAESKAQTFGVYPNPAKNTVNLSNVKLGNNINVFNTAGQEVLNTVADAVNVELNVSDLETGIYFVKIGEVSKKLIIE